MTAPTNGIWFGAHAAPAPGQDSEQALVALEELLGRRLDLHRMFRLWDDPVPDLIVARNVARGRVPVVSWRPSYRNGKKVPWAEIGAGRHDTRIRSVAESLRALPGPVVACLHHEPELATGYGAPAEFAGAYDRWRSIFDASGARNVAHAIICSPRAFRDHGAIMAGYWPTGARVDWVGVNAYNWFGCATGQDTHWVPLGNSCRSAVNWAAYRNLPLMVAEWGSVEDPAQSGRKAAWIDQAMEWAKTVSTVRAMSYLHAAGTCPWWLDSSEASLEAFRRAGAGVLTNVKHRRNGIG